MPTRSKRKSRKSNTVSSSSPQSRGCSPKTTKGLSSKQETMLPSLSNNNSPLPQKKQANSSTRRVFLKPSRFSAKLLPSLTKSTPTPHLSRESSDYVISSFKTLSLGESWNKELNKRESTTSTEKKDFIPRILMPSTPIFPA